MEDRICEQCGGTFQPRREHARFCSARCRATWNRAAGGTGAEASALGWAIVAMGDSAQRLSRTRPANRPHAFATISEAVWWVTIVDATLVRHHPDIRDSAMAAADRPAIEGTLAGLRFVRNRMGFYADPGDFIEPAGRGIAVARWHWRPVGCPALGALPPHGQEWEASRHRAYQEWLAGHAVGETFALAAGFLRLAAADIA